LPSRCHKHHYVEDLAWVRRIVIRKHRFDRDEAVQYLVEILKTPIGEVTADHRLAQSYDAKSGKIELPNKLERILRKQLQRGPVRGDRFARGGDQHRIDWLNS
jgi:hypothetical protein